MTYKDKLIDLLKSDDEVKTAIEKLEFGCKVKYYECYPEENEEYWTSKIIIGQCRRQLKSLDFDDYFACIDRIGDTSISTFIPIKNFECMKEDYKIIGLPLQERFIRMYCRNKLANLITNSWGEIATPDKSIIIENR